MIAAAQGVCRDSRTNPRLPLALRAGNCYYSRTALLQPQPAGDAGAADNGAPFNRRTAWALPMRSNFDPMNGINRMTIHHTSELPGMIRITTVPPS